MTMRRFALRLMAFLLLQIALLAWIVSPYRPNRDLFWAATVLKHDRLDTVPGPRLLLVGGSNVAFGLDSAQLADALPFEPVNMGLDAGLGLDFQLNEIRGALRPGDVVLLSPEYELFLGLRGGQASSLARVIEQRPASARYLARLNVMTLLDDGFGFAHWLVISARNRLDTQIIAGPYSLWAFNDYGDAIWHLDFASFGERMSKAMALHQRTPLDTSTIGLLNRFHQTAARAGALVVLSHPPLPDAYAHGPSRVAEVEAGIYQHVTIPRLDEPSDMFFPRDAFYDTEYHLLRDGRARRTALVIERLRAHLAPRLTRRAEEATAWRSEPR